MFAHLLDDPPIISSPFAGFIPLSKANPNQIVDGQIGTANWLEEMGADTEFGILTKEGERDARTAFTDRTTGQDLATQKQSLLALNTPPAVAHHVAMLTAYDWAFVEQAKELRGYVVAKLLEETESTDARYRLRALEMLGKVTEVGLFTDRVQITKIDLTDEALEARIKQKLDKFRHVIDVSDTIEQPQEKIVSTNS